MPADPPLVLAEADRARARERSRILGIREPVDQELTAELALMLVDVRARRRRRGRAGPHGYSATQLEAWRADRLLERFEAAHPGMLERTEQNLNGNRQGMR